ncbi:thiol:disulfide interchange protein DsbG [Enterobacteriaceae bacterium H4N4]|uniref:Thiol:disulfide interchange protein n=1 Tax=Silvania confinis TaxID=2926470 RepID=A0A9J6QKZ9_9ENTR|nr:thiol:disulfide interchange protein DsbG [Silvania confinis]MCU6670971.1 thiol:disulfide interchange protein DsbG [Silvania confinis]
MLKRFAALAAALPLLAFASDPLPPAIQQIEKQGVKIVKEIPAEGGLRGWLGQYQDMGVTVWLTPDGKHAVSGYLYDEKGNNLSEAVFTQELYIPQGRQLWEKLSAAKSIKEGNPAAKRKIVVFADPFCPYCKQFWAAAQPWVESGKVEINTLLVAVLNPQSGPNAAAILNAADPAKAWRDYELSNGKTLPASPKGTSKETFSLLQYNQKLMDEMGAAATPAIYYMNEKQELQQVVGMPDAQQLKAMMGPQ